MSDDVTRLGTDEARAERWDQFIRLDLPNGTPDNEVDNLTWHIQRLVERCGYGGLIAVTIGGRRRPARNGQ